MKNRFPKSFVPLEDEFRAVVGTAAAAYYLNRKEQTLRSWSCHQNGPLSPMKINGRLIWFVVDICRIVGCKPLIQGATT